MQKTPWFQEEQADVMLNYLPLRNVLIQGIKAMVKNKALPDSARHCTHPRLVILSLSLSLSLVSRVFSLSLSPMPFILRVSPGSYRGWTLAHALCKLGQLEVLFVLPEVLTLVLGPSFVLFLWAFPFLVFQLQPFWIPFSYSNYLIHIQQEIFDCISKNVKVISE